jgi:hypothetical protein
MTRTPDIDLTGPRWSAAVQCPRRCVYGARGVPESPPTPEQIGWRRRGKAWEQIVTDGMAARLIEEGRRPRRQELVSWPADDPVGTGHIDFYVPHEHTAIEVVSNAGGRLPDYKVLQVAGYALNHPHAEHAEVRSVDTHAGDEYIYPIVLDELEPRIRDIEAQVVAGLVGELPSRVCATPWDGPARWCPFVEPCFADWTPTPLDELLATRGEQRLVDELADAEDVVGARKAELERAVEKRDELRAKVAPLIAPGEPAIAGGIKVRRGVDYVTTSVSLKSYTDAGHPITPELEPFIRESIVSGRWTVKRLDDKAPPEKGKAS